MNIQIFSSKSSKDILEYYYIRFCEQTTITFEKPCVLINENEKKISI